MNASFVLYEKQTGRITGHGNSQPSTFSFYVTETIGLIEANPVDTDLFYVANGSIQPRPENPSQLVGKQLVNVPVPATIRINNTTYPSSEPTVDLSFTYPGTYHVTVEAFPMKPKQFTVVKP